MQSVRETEFQKAIHQELHDICQPMASLQCRLEVGRLLGGEEALAEAVDGGLEDLQRLSAALRKMRVLVSVLEERFAA